MKRLNSSSRRLSGLPKIPAKYASLVMPFLLSILMTCIVSLISTLRGVGWTHRLLELWPSAWGLSWLVAFPTLLLVLPLVKKLTALLLDH
jgi:hypothetical protein